ncbi:endonuclease/exonuclease/phosphatase family protein [Jannaschia sp. S6380]|uniref:endonuclease/exonuclease/phosphatase family protein n=1 Tax=Jannaschia sp. S6380 TaxID=2926408 RepID=UPI001FF1B676|nr:endonuclease/exonuclease/phosphatase family protein [Jannaschia sp. S6380]MCK0166348.1 endonuclease/exonuclease/phosphatase family protein [Jannaschia sp. S6380]
MRLKIVSWNIRKAVGLDWRRDPARVLDVLGAMAPDIILLQEADKRLPPRPPALPLDVVRDAGWHTIDADPETPSIGHHGNAILHRPDLRPTRVVGLDLPGLEPRGSVLARIVGRGSAITVAGMHLGLRAKDRRLQVPDVVAKARDLGDPVLMAGDLNEWRAGDDALDLPPDWRLVAPGPSFHATRPTLRLDRYIVGPGIEVVETGVLPKTEARRASDHLPVWMEIEIR